MVFHLENIPAGSGMGTCGLVGPIGIYTAMEAEPVCGWESFRLLPPPRCIDLYFRRSTSEMGWIKDGDLKLDL